MYVSLSSAAIAAAFLWAQPSAAQGCQAVDTKQTWDYIVIGSGAGGITVADKLSEAGKSVLLLEKGPPSTGRWGGTLKPSWLQNTQLTRFDVPGLCNEIWRTNTGVSCTDVDQMAGCVLGGGTAVNAGLWWKPHRDDWDTNFPDGWKSIDVKNATDRVFTRIPGTTTPSTDGKTYLTQGYDMLAGGLKKGGWEGLVPNDNPDKKNRTYGRATHMFAGGERGGPLATYLVTASARSNFKLQTYTSAKRIVRTGGHATGVEVECQGGQGRNGVYALTPNTGRVIVAAGALASPKVLFRSGIGPTDQLQVVQRSTDSATMIATASWINLPVGQNLLDHVGTDIEVAHPSVVFYDYYGAYNSPNGGDRDLYLSKRSGPLAQVAPNICMMFWEIVKGADGTDRHLHWQSRVEGSKSTSMTITQYLGTGAKSRGRLTITQQLNTRVSTQPYLSNAEDKAAVIKGVESAKAWLDGISGIEWIKPRPGQTVAAFVNGLQATSSQRGSNHWIGTAKLGTDSALKSGGTAVVDLNTQVYGTDNIFVVDASIFPGHVTGNPSAAIVIAAEHAAARILAVAPGTTN